MLKSSLEVLAPHELLFRDVLFMLRHSSLHYFCAISYDFGRLFNGIEGIFINIPKDDVFRANIFKAARYYAIDIIHRPENACSIEKSKVLFCNLQKNEKKAIRQDFLCWLINQLEKQKHPELLQKIEYLEQQFGQKFHIKVYEDVRQIVVRTFDREAALPFPTLEDYVGKQYEQYGERGVVYADPTFKF